MTGFICHDDYYDRLSRLTDEEVGHLFRQLMLYHSGRKDEMTDFIGMEGLAFDFMAADIDRMEETCEKNSRNGSKGGRPRKANETDKNPTKPNETELNQNKPDETEHNPTKAYKDKEKDINNNTKKENIKKKKEPFVQPTLEDVTAYCRERNNNVDPQKFMNYYESNGWKVGRNPMQDWQASVRTWERNDVPKPTRTVAAQQYSQRDYGGEQDDAMRRMLEGFT